MDAQPATSTTPILDLQQPLPRRSGAMTARNGLITGLVMAASATFVFLALSHPDLLRASLAIASPIVDFFAGFRGRGWLLLLLAATAWIPVVLVHEAGHLLAGRYCGWRPEGLTLAFLTLSWERGKPKLQFHRSRGIAGMAVLHLPNATRIHRKMAIMVAGGPMASLLFGGILLSAAGFAAEGSSLNLALRAGGWFSLFVGVINLVPFRTSGWQTDGARLLSLTRPQRARPWLCLILALEQHQRGRLARELNARWLRAALEVPEGTMDSLHAGLLAYGAFCDKKETEAAALWLEKCLRQSGLANGVMQDQLAMVAAHYHGWYRHNSEMLDRWLERVKRPKVIPEILHASVRAARDCALSRYADALNHWQAGMAEVEKMPESSQRDLQRRAWLEWKSEIEERAARSVAHSASAEN